MKERLLNRSPFRRLVALGRFGLTLLAVGALAHADVLVVDAADPTNFDEIQPAIDAAMDGDTILIREGEYVSFDIQAKSLELVGAGSQVRIGYSAPGPYGRVLVGHSSISALDNSQRVGVSNVTLGTLEIHDCQGAVRLQSIIHETASYGTWVFTDPTALSRMLMVSNCDDVVFIDVCLTPYHEADPWTSVGSSYLLNSNVACFGCEWTGASSTTQNDWTGVRGATLDGGSLYVSNCTFQGGDGSDGWTCSGDCCSDGHPGGNGLVIRGGGVLQRRDSVFRVGEAGEDVGCWSGGPTGNELPIFTIDGEVQPLFGIARYARTTTPTVRGTSATIELRGSPQDFVFLLETVDPARIPIQSPYVGQLFFAPGFKAVNAGVLDAEGLGTYSWTAPSHLAGASARTITLQPVFVDAFLGLLSLGGPTRTTVVTTFP